MNTENSAHENNDLSTRHVGSVFPTENTHADVELISFHEHRDNYPLVSLSVHDHAHEEEASVWMNPDEALLLANRLTRAANLALETAEQPPALEDELARLVDQQQLGSES